MMGGRVRQQVRVSGRVQGVGFRAAMQAKAQVCGVVGWVRNCADGSVEAAFEGDADAVAVLVEFCQSGPRLARIAQVDVHEEPTQGSTRFELRS